MTKIQTLSLLALMMLSSCSGFREGNGSGQTSRPDEAGKELIIVGTQEELRATQDRFAQGDEIGVYVYEAGSGTVLDAAENLKYASDAYGVFRGTSPKTPVLGDRKADVVAYYPYSASVSNRKLAVDLSDQTDPSKIDLLWGKATAGKLTLGYRMPVRFEHKLGLIELTFARVDAAHPLPRVAKATAKGVRFSAVLDLYTGELTVGTEKKDVTAVMDDGHKAYLLLMPGEVVSGLTFEFDGHVVDYLFPSPVTIKAGKKAAVTIRPKGNAVIETSAAAYMEIPVALTAPGSAIEVTHFAPDDYFAGGTTPGGERRNYSLLYDKKMMQPLWVAYPLYKDCIGGSGRNDEWRYDPDPKLQPTSIQPDLSGSYKPSGLDWSRGHMLASNNRTATVALNKTTFYFTNMVPQNQTQNGGVWQTLEGKEHDWANNPTRYKLDTLFVVSGPVFPTAGQTYVQDNSGKDVAVPEYTYKAILAKRTDTGEWRSMAVKIPNRPNVSKEWKDYMVTVKSLEEELGFVFFTQLPADIADKVKSQKNAAQWN